jgi:uncharacterized C2H2 Zn-finger protein
MFFIFIIGTRFVTWGGETTGHELRCSKCGTVAPFIEKKGMRFITLFFIPVLPVSGTKHLLQCPACGTRFKAD